MAMGVPIHLNSKNKKPRTTIISGPMGTKLVQTTQVRHAPRERKVTILQPPNKTSWAEIREVWNSFEVGGGGGGLIDKLCKSHFMNYLNSTPSEKTSPTAILDSGATGNFLAFDAPCVNKKIVLTPMEVKLPNVDFIKSTHAAEFNIPALHIAAREAHIFPNHFQHSLLYVTQICDNGCEVNFLAHNVTVKLNGDTLCMGQCKHDTELWRVNLTASLSELKPTPQAMYNVYEQRSIEDSIVYLHAACFSPVKDTLIKAIEEGNFSGWPGLTPDRVRKYLHKAYATVKGHINQQR
jgi:hypothetical protein